jgi:hypothetical protein
LNFDDDFLFGLQLGSTPLLAAPARRGKHHFSSADNMASRHSRQQLGLLTYLVADRCGFATVQHRRRRGIPLSTLRHV